jgi:hypothetical protein
MRLNPERHLQFFVEIEHDAGPTREGIAYAAARSAGIETLPAPDVLDGHLLA